MLFMMQALDWLTARLVDKQLLVTLLNVLSTLLDADTAQQAQQRIAVHANITLHLHAWTALLLKTLRNFKESSGTEVQVLEKVLCLMHSCGKN